MAQRRAVGLNVPLDGGEKAILSLSKGRPEHAEDGDVEVMMGEDWLRASDSSGFDRYRRKSLPGAGGGSTTRAVSVSDLPGDEHVSLCPLGGGGTRWYVCRRHESALLFQAGSGRLDSVANSCPVCGGLSVSYSGCACEHSLNLLDRSQRPGRQVRHSATTE